MKKRKSEPAITFRDWIEETGVQVIAQRLGVHPQTVWHWRAGRADPKAEHIAAIKKLSRGRLSYEAIIDRDDLQNCRAQS